MRNHPISIEETLVGWLLHTRGIADFVFIPRGFDGHCSAVMLGQFLDRNNITLEEHVRIAEEFFPGSTDPTGLCLVCI